MTISDIFTIFPLVIPVVGLVVLVLLVAVKRCHALILLVTLISLTAAALAAVLSRNDEQTHHVTQLLVMDGYARFYMALIYVTTCIVCIQSYGYLKHSSTVREEYYILLLGAALGSAVLVSADHFASLFIGIELLSLSLYTLIAYLGTQHNIEAGIKYFVLTAVSISFLLFGIAMIYGARGTMKLPGLVEPELASNSTSSILFLTGTGMVLVGVSFKLALVPFNFWAADVFQGTPAPVTGFVATVSKGAVFAVLLRYFSGIDIVRNNSLFFILASISVSSMFFGNIAALLQNNIKRILAYSSIAHFGYLLVALIANRIIGVPAAAFYITAYFATTLTIFGIMTFLSRSKSDFDTIGDYRGLSYRHPVYAVILTVAMLSLAGIPLTGGFIAKFYLISAGAATKLWLLLIILVINSVIGLFYYLRIVITLYIRSSQENRTIEKTTSPGPSFSWIGGVSLAALLILLVYLGIIPGVLLSWIRMLVGISI